MLYIVRYHEVFGIEERRRTVSTGTHPRLRMDLCHEVGELLALIRFVVGHCNDEAGHCPLVCIEVSSLDNKRLLQGSHYGEDDTRLLGREMAVLEETA